MPNKKPKARIVSASSNDRSFMTTTKNTGLSQRETLEAIILNLADHIWAGYPELKDHITGVMALMRAAPNWDSFRRSLQRAYPKLHETMPLALGDDE